MPILPRLVRRLFRRRQAAVARVRKEAERRSADQHDEAVRRILGLAHIRRGRAEGPER